MGRAAKKRTGKKSKWKRLTQESKKLQSPEIFEAPDFVDVTEIVLEYVKYLLTEKGINISLVKNGYDPQDNLLLYLSEIINDEIKLMDSSTDADRTPQILYWIREHEWDLLGELFSDPFSLERESRTGCKIVERCSI